MSNEILKERGSVYGDFRTNLLARANIMNNLDKVHLGKTTEKLDSVHYQAINDIVIKLVRLAASPEHIDSWRDLSLYAQLNVTRLGGDMNSED